MIGTATAARTPAARTRAAIGPTVSRRHAEFRWENDEFHVVDVGSLNSTYVNREPVDSAVLVNGDEVQIGKFRLTFLTKPKNHGGAGGTHDSGSTDR
jgi:pSer/pThr/pTyr-binding forkhead associated (FHA) protein